MIIVVKNETRKADYYKDMKNRILNSIDFYLSKGMYNYEIYKNLKKVFGVDLIEKIGKNRINEICNDMREGFNSNISLVKRGNVIC